MTTRPLRQVRWTDLPALAFALTTIGAASGIVFIPHVLDRILHVGIGWLMIFVGGAAAARGAQRLHWTVAALSSLAVTGYALYYFPISYDYVGLPPTSIQLVLGAAAILLTVAAVWATSGISIPVVMLIVFFYAYFGDRLPHPFTHAGLDLSQSVQALYVTARGIYGSIAGVSASYIVLFVLFATYLARLDFVGFAMQKSRRALGSTRGAAPKLAVVSSASLGLVMGSAYGNTATTGAFTIPLMKRTGFTAGFAAAVEAAASVGGQFVPPVLGGAAFLMVDILGISYVTVMIACIPLAVMFYFSIFLMVDMEVVRLNRTGRLSEQAVEQDRDLPFGGWLKLVPVFVLVLVMGNGYTPQYAGFWAIVSVLAVDVVESRSANLVFSHLLDGLIAGAKASAIIVGIVAAAGIINGVTGTTGLALGLAGVLVDAAGGSKIILLLLCAAVTVVLGMGLPTLLAYLLMAVLVVPALVETGVPPLVAHLFIMYYSSMSSITPPVGPDNFIAATIAGPPAHPLKVGMLACRLAAPAFFVPFIFAYHPGILFVLGFDWGDLVTLLGVALGIYALNASQSGILLPSLAVDAVGTRLLLFATGVALVWPDWLATTLGAAALLGIHLWVGGRHRHDRTTRETRATQNYNAGGSPDRK